MAWQYTNDSCIISMTKGANRGASTSEFKFQKRWLSRSQMRITDWGGKLIPEFLVLLGSRLYHSSEASLPLWNHLDEDFWLLCTRWCVTYTVSWPSSWMHRLGWYDLSISTHRIIEHWPKRGVLRTRHGIPLALVWWWSLWNKSNDGPRLFCDCWWSSSRVGITDSRAARIQ